ncbi:MAG TPA: DUF1641 domain-containing protein [Lysinibacillus sp.]|uniref:DUF1641 domain-containing protein n=1 Tax=unclassified Lysinibacillus TaxID=2636778 RepID=UPI000738812B|nr:MULTISPECIES: DUF1641 domain-containing protein [unclassified Lysinibacillus]HBT72602.1 DUF1641 domain-containing protein [Lysinibacillus sp.]KUF32059.1 hypothetical protein AK833_14860 [Lysinibacillus sp. F5]SCY32117.1 Uncharacterized conserved protein YjgD, DUF1641 family [Lysinibacillus sp. SG9]SDB16991.1 Uncharacterized conserved protein YjgD, DUF1641 family [Lysinibacillus sp. TC-37]SFS64027.1 Uncharacterized conserved protein YjgD, DUF1641 family [Lysinibacillus sp. SG55]
MAVPITSIKKQQLTEEQLKEQKLDNLKELLSDNEEAVNQVFSIMAELNDIGALEAAMKLLEAKEDVAHIALGQLTRKPVTNIINNLMGVAGALTELNPETTTKLIDGLNSGVDEASKALESNEKVSAFKLMKMLNDPDVNRALNFGVHFLKGLGKGLKE